MKRRSARPKREVIDVLQVMRIGSGDGGPLPQYQTDGASGLDLHASVYGPVEIAAGKRAAVPTGVAVAIPAGFEGQVRSRSGLAAKQGVFVLNSPGTIDADYRGEIIVILANLGDTSFIVRNGDRIAQMVLCPVARLAIREVAELPTTPRGAAGLGSTGVRGRGQP